MYSTECSLIVIPTCIPDTMGGYTINKQGHMNSDTFTWVSKKDKCFIARKELISDATIGQNEDGTSY